MNIVLSLLLFFYLSSCQKQEKPADVVVSVPPYLFFVQELTQGELSAISLVPPNANPHIYEPTPTQAQQALSAKVWIRLGEHFETKVAHAIQERNPHMLMLDLSQKLPSSQLLTQSGTCACHHHKGNIDLHLWMSLRLAKQQADLIAEALMQAFPDKKPLIQKQLLSLQKNLSETDARIQQELLPYAHEAILVSHPAFAYLCRDYQLQQISIESEGKDPLPQQMLHIEKMAQATPIRVVLTQVQYNNKGAQILANKLHLPIHSVDPYQEDYLKNFLHITHLIASP